MRRQSFIQGWCWRWRWGLVAAVVWLAGCAAVPVWGASNRLVGDEPHYLLTTASLVFDGDVDLADDYATRSYTAYHASTLAPQDAARDDGSRLTPHGVGLSLLLVPGYAIGGWVGARVELALLAALVLAGAGVLAERFVSEPRWAAPAAAVALGVSAPLWIYSTQVYPEVPAAGLVVAAALVVTGDRRRRRPVAAACVLACLVGLLALLGIKYLPVAAALGAVALVRLRHSRAAMAVTCAVSVALVCAVFAWTAVAYGGPTTYATNRLYQGASEATILQDNVGGLARTPRVAALLFDRNFGIARFAPLWVLVAAAAVVLALRRRSSWPLWVLVAVQWATAVWLALTMRGWWFPGRQVVTVLPLLVPAAAYALALVPRVGGLLAAWSALWGGALVWALGTRRVGAGRDPFLAPIPGFGAFGRLFPSFHDPGVGDWVRLAGWLGLTAVTGVWLWRVSGRARAHGGAVPAATGAATAAGGDAAGAGAGGGLVVGFPARDEEATVAGLVRRAQAIAGVVEVVVVDDHSVDATRARAVSAGATVLEPASGHAGLGAAVGRLLAHARDSGAAAVAFLDADGEYAPEDVAAVAEPVLAGTADYVTGNRFAAGAPAGMPLWRRLGNRCGSLVVGAIVGRRIHDSQSGIRVLGRSALDAGRVRHDYNYAQVLTIDLCKQGFRMQEVAVSYERRRHGHTYVRLPSYLRHVVPAMVAARWGR
ncbi:MAG: glycosyltransferase family 2 protein [Acidimicrobiia bacterium]